MCMVKVVLKKNKYIHIEMAINGLEAIIFPNGPSLSSCSLRLRDQFNVQTTCKEHQQNFDDGSTASF